MGDGGNRRLTPSSYPEAFREAFPEYLAMGMSYDEYWNKDSTLVIAYRKAYQMRRDNRNFEMWLQGRYIYDAIAALSSILRTSLSKQPIKAEKYVERPYPLTKEEADRIQEEKRVARMNALLESLKRESAINLAKKEAGENG